MQALWLAISRHVWALVTILLLSSTSLFIAIRCDYHLPPVIGMGFDWRDALSDMQNSANAIWHHRATFPGNVREVTSPDNEFTVVCVDGANESEDFPHQLFLRRRDSEVRTPIDLPETKGFGRCVDVIWAPDSKSLAVNNWLGSNIADACIYCIGNLSHPLVLDCPNDKSPLASEAMLHRYTFVQKWIGSGSAELVVFGDYVKNGSAEDGGVACSSEYEYYVLNTSSGIPRLVRSLDEPYQE